MIPDLKSKPKIVIDTSFWINVVYLGIDNYLLNYFNLYVVSKVEKEILDESDYKIYDSEDMEIYSKLKDRGLITIKNPQKLSKRVLDDLEVDSGELYSIELAIEENMIVATDDKGAVTFSNKNNLIMITSIDFILKLYIDKIISIDTVLYYFNLLEKKIKPKYIEEGRRRLNEM